MDNIPILWRSSRPSQMMSNIAYLWRSNCGSPNRLKYLRFRWSEVHLDLGPRFQWFFLILNLKSRKKKIITWVMNEFYVVVWMELSNNCHEGQCFSVKTFEVEVHGLEDCWILLFLFELKEKILFQCLIRIISFIHSKIKSFWSENLILVLFMK